MAACEAYVIEKTLRPKPGYKTIEDQAAERLDEWNRWMNHGPKVGPQEPTCNLGRVQEQRVAAGTTGAPVKMPHSVDEVEKVVRGLSFREKKLIETFYEYTPMHVKAKECHLNPSGYWKAIQRLRRRVYMELY